MFGLLKKKRQCRYVKKDFAILDFPLKKGGSERMYLEGTPEQIRLVMKSPLLLFIDQTGKVPSPEEVRVDIKKYHEQMQAQGTVY